MMFGLTKIYPAGTFLPSEVNAFFTEFKARLVEGGVVVQQNEVSEFRWGASGVISGQQSDDSPFWGLSGSDN